MNSIDLTGTWLLKNLSDKTIMDDIAVTVPGSVISGALENNLISHPYYGNNEAHIQYLFNNHYSFSKTFTLDPTVISSDKVILNCAGLDTLATIYINNSKIAETNNMFHYYEINIKPYVISGENTIEIQFYSPVQYLEDLKQQGANGLAYLRKAQCMFGWDWGIKLPDSGIWKSITIEYGNYKNIPHLYFEQTHNTQNIELQIHSDMMLEQNTSLAVTLYDPSDKTIKSTTIDATQSLQHTFIIENPQLWWPVGYGDQPLYKVHIALFNENDLLDETDYSIGLRTVELNRENDQDGSKFEFIINDTPIFLKGTNMIIEDAILNQTRKYDLPSQIKDCLRANINCIRVWGGAYYPSDQFFELCNKYGILVIQDCMFTSVSYPTDTNFLENITIELTQNIQRIAHQPSLILLFGNNEIDMTYTMLTSDDPRTEKIREFFDASKITDDNIKNVMQERYKKLFLETIPNIINQIAPQIPYAHSSPNTKSTNESKSIFDYAKDGDFHYYLAYDGQAPYEYVGNIDARFISEMGFQSYPNIKTIDTFAEKQAQYPNSSIMLAHQKCKDGNSIIDNYMQKEFNMPTNFTAYVYLSQILAGIVMQYAIEHFRAENHYCRGVLIWQMNDCWPTISWSGVDYYGRWKAQQYFTKRFYSPVLPAITIKYNRAQINVINDSNAIFNGSLQWKLKQHNDTLDSGDIDFTVAINSHSQTIELPFHDLVSDKNNEVYFEYTLYDNETVIATGVELFVKPRYFDFKKPNITYSISELNNQYVIELASDQMTKYVECDLTDDDCIFSDNYFDLTADFSKTITVDKRSLSSELDIASFEQQLQITSLNETQI